jgi:hypothetical protein
MAQVTVTAQRVIHGPVEQVRTAIADYQSTRPKILTDHYSDYQLKGGGHGAGSLVHWKLAATEKRVRDVLHLRRGQPGAHQCDPQPGLHG